MNERAITFPSAGCRLLGIVAAPADRDPAPVGVVIVVGGPQYRAGSHRQFTLLARALAQQGIASLRFDYHGIGDSEGPPALGVEGIEEDIRSAVDLLMREVPTLAGVALWGLCGGASASALYAPSDERVAGLAMLNPWVRTEQGRARAQLRHYYLDRVTDWRFWGRMLRGDVAVASSIRSFAGQVRGALLGGGAAAPSDAGERWAEPPPSLPDRMLDTLQQTRLPALVVLSGDKDLTANEFRELRRGSEAWRSWLASAQVRAAEIEGSNHTFARADWRAEVERLTAEWVLALPPPQPGALRQA